MSHINVTSSYLEGALASIQKANSEAECGASLVAAATRIQRALLGGQSSAELMDLLSIVGEAYPTSAEALLDRTVDMHQLEDGAHLGLWLVPVAVTTDFALESTIPLTSTALSRVVVESLIQGSLGLANPRGAKISQVQGWVQVVPRLYAEAALECTQVSELVKLPHRVRNMVRGASKKARFTVGSSTPKPGVQIFYLPVVSYSAPGFQVSAVEPLIPMATTLVEWVKASLPSAVRDDCALQASAAVQPCSQSFEVGSRMRLELSVKQLLGSVIEQASVEPNGMAALVALYHPQGFDMRFVGITLMSRLSRHNVGLLNIPVESSDGLEELAQVRQALNEAGVSRVTTTPAPVATVVCQHCGGPQYLSLHPNQMTGAEDASHQSNRLH